MATKVATKTKKVVAKKAATKKKGGITWTEEGSTASAPAKKAPAKKKAGVGGVYECKVCGLAVSVIGPCDCVEACDLICCEEAMKPKRTKAA